MLSDQITTIYRCTLTSKMVSWPYQFKDLSEEDKIARRNALNHNANLAQLSVPVPLLLLQVCLITSSLKRRWIVSRGSRSLSASKARRHLLASSQLAWRRFVWWCGDSIGSAEVTIERKGDVLAAGVWSVWLLICCFKETGDGTHSQLEVMKASLSTPTCAE